jgi:DNA-binding CsgD family transcriptional regulator
VAEDRREVDRTALLATLTPRQREVLQLIAKGLSTKQIAARLGIAVKTADTHRMALYARLGVHNVAEAVRVAVTKLYY